MGAFIAYRPTTQAGLLPTNPAAHLTALVTQNRANELIRLNSAYSDNHTRVVQLLAPCGTGKTTLLQAWLQQCAQDGWQNIDAIYGWVFAAHNGTADPNVMLDDCFQHILSWLGASVRPELTLRERAELVAHTMRQQRMVLILDNLPVELIQSPSAGEYLQHFLQQLLPDNPGLCVLAATEAVLPPPTDEIHVLDIHLPNLQPVDGAHLLQAKGLQGREEELTKVSAQFGNHALSLVLLANYLREAHAGNIAKLDTIPIWLDMHDEGRYVRRILAALEYWKPKSPEMALVYLLCAFDLPVAKGVLFKLLQQRTPFGIPFARNHFPAVLMPLRNIKADRLQQLENFLRKMDLLVLTTEADFLQLRLPIREYFRSKIQSRASDVWDSLYELVQADQIDASLMHKLTQVQPSMTVTRARVLARPVATPQAISLLRPANITTTAPTASPEAAGDLMLDLSHAALELAETPAPTAAIFPAIETVATVEALAHEVNTLLDTPVMLPQAAMATPDQVTPTALDPLAEPQIAPETDTRVTLAALNSALETLAAENLTEIDAEPVITPVSSDNSLNFSSSTSACGESKVILPNLEATLLANISMETQLQEMVESKHWFKAANMALKLYQKQLNVGNLPAATHSIRQSVAYAHLSGDQVMLHKHLQLLNQMLERTGEKPARVSAPKPLNKPLSARTETPISKAAAA